LPSLSRRIVKRMTAARSIHTRPSP
jgi:hypothetical protein